MGGYGSNRWSWHTKKQTADSSKRLNITAYTAGLRSIERGEKGSLAYAPCWHVGGVSSGDILLTFHQGGDAIEAWADYTHTNMFNQKSKHRYQVGLQTTLTNWDSRRYWWSCPQCRQRCGTLYMPPGAAVFACRSCHNLTYTSCQESHGFDRLMSGVLKGAGMGMTPSEFKALLEWQRGGSKGEVPKKLKKRWEWALSQACEKVQQQQEQQVREELELLREEREEEQAKEAARMARYLSPAALCERAGLTADELASLGAARLLNPDKEGKYRPKLEGWAGKLAYLLHDGWDLHEITRWARGRWAAGAARQWPPVRADWQGRGESV